MHKGNQIGVVQVAQVLKRNVVDGLGVKGTAIWNESFSVDPLTVDLKQLGGNGRGWQGEAFKYVSDAQYALIAAFCGSGKTILQIYLAAHDKGR
jgi:hypothetical protein